MDRLLNFKGQGLTEIPGLLLQQNDVTNLNLENNRISVIPEWIRELTHLKVLYLSGNLIRDISPLIHLPALEVLYLNDNCISQIPDDLSRWGRLKRLFINGNMLDRLPGSLGELRELKILLAAGNQIGDIDDGLFLLSNLEILYLFKNRLTHIPEQLCRCERLEYLQVSMNWIRWLPESIGGNVRLAHLDAFSNRLKDIPSGLVRSTALKGLNVADNNIERIEHVPDSIQRLSIYANPVKFIEPRIVDSFRGPDERKDEYLYVDSEQAGTLELNDAGLGDRLKVIDIPSGKISWKDYKAMPQELVAKWGLQRSMGDTDR